MMPPFSDEVRMDTFRFMPFFFCLCVIVLSATPALSLEIRMEGDRVVIIDDNGNTLDTANPPSAEVREGGAIQVNDDGVSIGSVINTGGEQKNVVRKTSVDNVTLIRNGKTTIYRKNESRSAAGERQDTHAKKGDK